MCMTKRVVIPVWAHFFFDLLIPTFSSTLFFLHGFSFHVISLADPHVVNSISSSFFFSFPRNLLLSFYALRYWCSHRMTRTAILTFCSLTDGEQETKKKKLIWRIEWGVGYGWGSFIISFQYFGISDGVGKLHAISSSSFFFPFRHNIFNTDPSIIYLSTHACMKTIHSWPISFFWERILHLSCCCCYCCSLPMPSSCLYCIR